MTSIASPPHEKTHKTFSTFGPGKVAFHDEDDGRSSISSAPPTWRSLVKPPIVKQWLFEGKIYRERRERIPSRFELFFDLVFVAIAHQLSDAAAEHANGAGFVQFILTFFPTWSLWSEFRAFVNASGTDDLLQRVGILYMMAILIGYTANASSITLGQSEETTASVGETLAMSVVRAIFAEEGPVESSGSKRDPALVATTAFYLLGRSLRMGFLFVYAILLPRFRAAMFVQLIHQTLLFVIYVPLLVIRSKTAIITLAALGVAIDTMMRYLVGIYRVLFYNKPHPQTDIPEEKGKSTTDLDQNTLGAVVTKDICAFEKERGKTKLRGAIPALNIEHFLERTAAFVVIVLGEMVMSVAYHATGSQVGLKPIYGNAICGLVIAFSLCWLYFDAECARLFLHAIRRHWFSSLTFTTLHFPLCASLILVSAAMSRITQNEEEVPNALRWYLGGGLGCALLCMTGIGATHRGLDPTGATVIGRRIQLSCRAIVGIIMICLPLAERLNPLKMMITCAGLLVFLVIEETVGKIHRATECEKRMAEGHEVNDQGQEAQFDNDQRESQEGELVKEEKVKDL